MSQIHRKLTFDDLYRDRNPILILFELLCLKQSSNPCASIVHMRMKHVSSNAIKALILLRRIAIF